MTNGNDERRVGYRYHLKTGAAKGLGKKGRVKSQDGVVDSTLSTVMLISMGCQRPREGWIMEIKKRHEVAL